MGVHWGGFLFRKINAGTELGVGGTIYLAWFMFNHVCYRLHLLTALYST